MRWNVGCVGFHQQAEDVRALPWLGAGAPAGCRPRYLGTWCTCLVPGPSTCRGRPYPTATGVGRRCVLVGQAGRLLLSHLMAPTSVGLRPRPG